MLLTMLYMPRRAVFHDAAAADSAFAARHVIEPLRR